MLIPLYLLGETYLKNHLLPSKSVLSSQHSFFVDSWWSSVHDFCFPHWEKWRYSHFQPCPTTDNIRSSKHIYIA